MLSLGENWDAERTFFPDLKLDFGEKNAGRSVPNAGWQHIKHRTPFTT